MNLVAPLLATRPMPRPPAAPAPHEAALRRAFEAAQGVPVEPAGLSAVWRFHVLPPDAASAVAWLLARRVEEAAGLEAAMAALDQMRSVPGWVVVTCARTDDADRAAHYRERSLTAVQRVSLQLWSEGIRTSWSTEMALEEPAFYEAVGADPVGEAALGVLWYGHAEKR